MFMFNKLNSAKLCSNTHGQAALDCVVNTPQPGDPSYELFMKEKVGYYTWYKYINILHLTMQKFREEYNKKYV